MPEKMISFFLSASRNGYRLSTRFLALVLVAIVTVLVGSSRETIAQYYQPREQSIRAAFLLNFARYVDFPPETFPKPTSPIVIAILGYDPFGKVLDETVAGRTTKNRTIEIRRIDEADEVDGCHIVFISRAERRRQEELLNALRGKPVLTVGERDDFLEEGGGIRLVRVDNTLKIEVSLINTDRSGLRLSSRMLILARKVIRSPEHRDPIGENLATSTVATAAEEKRHAPR